MEEVYINQIDESADFKFNKFAAGNKLIALHQELTFIDELPMWFTEGYSCVALF
jgi:hypothetical protein